jgi:hypothetical protein
LVALFEFVFQVQQAWPEWQLAIQATSQTQPVRKADGTVIFNIETAQEEWQLLDVQVCSILLIFHIIVLRNIQIEHRFKTKAKHLQISFMPVVFNSLSAKHVQA